MSLLPPVGWADVATNHDLDARIDALGDRLDAKIDALGDRLDARIDALGDRLDARIDALGDRLDARIDAVHLAVEALRASTALQIENSRLASEKAMAQFEARIHRDMLRLTWSMIAGFVAVAGVLTANSVL